MRRNGESVASIARKTHVSEPTVRKYLAKEDLSAVPSVRKPRASVIDPYLPVIEQWLAEDRANWRKQRHTATRIWERLRDEHGAEVSLSTVTRAVARLRREFAAERDEAFMDLVWHPGEAQADFGEVDVLLRGVVQRMHHFVLDFPYSNVGLVQLMPGENAECTCLALRNLFEWLGGVPERIVFDNAAGVGHKGYGEREPRLTHLFQAFQAHYGFDCSFCNPYSGHEKGAVESKVGMVRRKLFVPRPSVWSLENFNAGLPDRCLELATKPHYRKDTEERGLFSEDRAALLPLPGKRFDVVTWRHMKADRYGVVTLEGRHRYSADRANAGREVIVGLRALEVEVLDSSGKHLATHPRAYGQASTNSEDPSMQLALLCNKPASWPNSRVRDALPDPLREWLDRQDRQTRNEALQTLKRVDRESGWANAVEAMLSILESTGGADRAGVTLLAARLLRRARFPVVKGLDGYDFTNVRLPDGYMLDELLGLGFIPRAQDLVFYGKTGRGKTHLAIGLGMKAIDMGLGVRFHQTAELVLQLGKAKRDGTLETMLRDIGRADLIILDEFGYVPFDIDGARLLYQIIAGSYERRSIIFTTNIEFSKWGTVFADDKLAAAIIDRIVHHGRLLEFTGQSRRVSEALMFGRNTSAQPEK